MKMLKLITILFIFNNSLSRGEMAGNISIKVTPWKSTCSELNCDLPEPSEKGFLITGIIGPLKDPGTSLVHTYPLQTKKITGNVSIYSVIPEPSSNNPAYVQIKVEILKPFYVLCAQSVQWKKESGISPLICAGKEKDERLGLTLQMKFD